jgi:hypothetical protein
MRAGRSDRARVFPCDPQKTAIPWWLAPCTTGPVARGSLHELRADCRGAGLVEYVLALGLVAVLAFSGWRAFGSSVDDKAAAQAECIRTLSCAPGSADEAAAPTRRERVDAQLQAAAATGGDPPPAPAGPPPGAAAVEPDADPPPKQPRARSVAIGAADGSNVQWVKPGRMDDLVKNGLGRKVDVDGTPHVVVTTPFGAQVMTFVYKMDVNPASLGAREWALAGMYNRGPVDVPEVGVDEALARRDTEEAAKRYAKRPREDAFAGAKQNSLQLIIVGINMLPGGGSADAIDRGDYVDATISFVGDVALLGATRLRGAAKGARALTGAAAANEMRKLQRATVALSAVEGTVAVARVGQAGYAVMHDEEGKAAGYLGEAVLRIFGVRYAIKALPKDVPELAVLLRKYDTTPGVDTGQPILFGQANVSPRFSKGGLFKGADVDEVVARLQRGELSPDDLPVQYIWVDGQKMVVNNRSLTALSKAGMKPTRTVDMTGKLGEGGDDSLASVLGRLETMEGNKPSATISVRESHEDWGSAAREVVTVPGTSRNAPASKRRRQPRRTERRPAPRGPRTPRSREGCLHLQVSRRPSMMREPMRACAVVRAAFFDHARRPFGTDSRAGECPENGDQHGGSIRLVRADDDRCEGRDRLLLGGDRVEDAALRGREGQASGAGALSHVGG